MSKVSKKTWKPDPFVAAPTPTKLEKWKRSITRKYLIALEPAAFAEFLESVIYARYRAKHLSQAMNDTLTDVFAPAITKQLNAETKLLSLFGGKQIRLPISTPKRRKRK